MKFECSQCFWLRNCAPVGAHYQSSEPFQDAKCPPRDPQRLILYSLTLEKLSKSKQFGKSYFCEAKPSTASVGKLFFGA